MQKTCEPDNVRELYQFLAQLPSDMPTPWLCCDVIQDVDGNQCLIFTDAMYDHPVPPGIIAARDAALEQHRRGETEEFPEDESPATTTVQLKHELKATIEKLTRTQAELEDLRVVCENNNFEFGKIAAALEVEWGSDLAEVAQELVHDCKRLTSKQRETGH